ncbi:hypothetical protein BZA70DRAFT_276899 [Myxozyma melibiosi]|uniref:Regulator of free ubiquitin chains 1 n=1 Tax=Myxozyma melibiosi TaxID=54550 RepID=A0ABR1F7C1_9ASCO
MKSRTGASSEAADRPRLISRSIAELSAIANEYDFDPALRLRYWIRSASTLERQARIYDDEKVYDEAYILYMRYAQLVLNSLHTHPEARRIPEKVLLVKLTKVSVKR